MVVGGCCVGTVLIYWFSMVYVFYRCINSYILAICSELLALPVPVPKGSLKLECNWGGGLGSLQVNWGRCRSPRALASGRVKICVQSYPPPRPHRLFKFRHSKFKKPRIATKKGFTGVFFAVGCNRTAKATKTRIRPVFATNSPNTRPTCTPPNRPALLIREKTGNFTNYNALEKARE